MLARDSRAERTAEARLQEAVGLVRALDVEIVAAETTPLNAPRAGTLFGGGKVDQLGGRIALLEADLVVIDGVVTPIQQRNLERAWNVKLLDRTGLILEIFGDRAQTREGELQVELAHLEYQKGRLVRSWTHLERQRGGVGFLGGPGETQIEADRRALNDRIVQLKARLEKVVRTRSLHRKSRKQAPYPMVALVGYTNAGKSTLFNRLTSADVMAEDMLFATLDPTMRAIRLPNGTKAIIADTVGFISDLPTQLVAAFRATLEEVLAADLIVHVRDVSSEDAEAQRGDVIAVLRELGVAEPALEQLIEARNKLDALDESARASAINEAARDENAVCLSARDGDGVTGLLRRIEARLTHDAEEIDLALAPESGEALAWLYEHGCVLERADLAGGVSLKARMTPLQRGRFEKRFGPILPASGPMAAQ